MHAAGRDLVLRLLKRNTFKRIVAFSTKPELNEVVGNLSQKETQSVTQQVGGDVRKPIVPPNYRFIYPEFLPDPKIEWRNLTREKLERIDMMERRKNIEIPEFYVGSILAVTSSDPHAAGKVSRFVGICIDRDRCGLRARFILRNVIDQQGVEVQYEMYDPTIQKIEVLRLEKRLDDHLLYLRDALPEYSTFDPEMAAEMLPEGADVPVNDMKVRLRPRPWLERWERQNLRGVANIDDYLNDKHRRTALAAQKPWEAYDLMKQYRSTIPEEEQKAIYAEVHTQLHQLELTRNKNKRKSFTNIKPNELA